MADAEESPAQRQARIRREKREKKIREGGSARLDKITGLSGRSVEANTPSEPTSDSAPALSTPSAEDPPEADISSYSTRSSQRPPSAGPRAHNQPKPQPDAQQQQFLELLRGAGAGPGNGTAPQQTAGETDPMAQLLQQMLGSMPGAGGGAGGPPGSDPFDPSGAAGGLPPGLAAMLGGGGAGSQGTQPAPRSTYLWKILHALASVLLGVYVLYAYKFTGSSASRHAFALGEDDVANVFWLFATVELVLQSSRYLLKDKGAPPVGWMATVVNFLPPPWNERVRLGNQYVGMVLTFVGDALVLVFVLGVAAWWRGAAA